MIQDIAMIRKAYKEMPAKVKAARKVLGKPMTLAEKILSCHLAEPLREPPVRKSTYVLLNPDRVAMQDATAQMALLQFMHAGRKASAVPATVHCDHLICAQDGAKADLEKAISDNREVYDFLKSVARKYGMGFWKPGAGIIHQIVLENYAFPGGLMIGTDSHTPNAGGLGMISVGVGGADAVDVMAGMPWELRWPGLVGVKLTGKLSGWTSPKDIILYLLGKLTVKGGTGKIVEYFGPGAEAISCTGKATATNMGAELGATNSVFAFDKKMAAFLRATGREDVAKLSEAGAENLCADKEVYQSPEKYYDEVIEIDLSKLEPHVVGPHTPDMARPVSKMREDAAKNGYPEALSAGLLGSCTNASYEDIGRAASVAAQALKKGLCAVSKFYITPGSEMVRATVERDGYLDTLSAFGGVLLANACGQCIGQWNRKDPAMESPNSIATTFNRNFHKRNDGSPNTFAFISSPEIVTAMAAAGKLVFDPAGGTLAGKDGNNFKLDPPSAPDLPGQGFAESESGLLPPASDPVKITLNVDQASKRLQLLDPFPAWNGRDMDDLLVLVKVKGKCTTDHISPAGPWLKFRGHLDNISDNMLLGAINAYTGEAGKGKNALSGEAGLPFQKIARDYKSKEKGWVVIGDENYGEGSSREHAAMSPRHLGARAVIAKNFARIHETNLKKQGVLPLTFENPDDYDRVQADDIVAVRGLSAIQPGRPLMLGLRHADGKEELVPVNHSLSDLQIEWFKAGSALNLIAARQKA
jgi:aconitate hydratase